MALRAIEFVLPDREEDAIDDALEDLPILDLWHVHTSDDRVVGRALIQLEDAEALLAVLQDRFGSREDFRVTILDVQATLPRPEEAEPSEEEETPEEADGSSRPSRVSIEELHADVTDMSRITGTFLVMVALASVVGAIGLIVDSTAIVIGSMVIAPLLGPNVALALSATLADAELGRRAVTMAAIGFALAAAVAFVIGAVVEVDVTANQIASRGTVSLWDIALGLAVGGAGVLSVTTGVSTALVGVMVAVALLPPLVAMGLFAGSGHFELAYRAGLLVVAYLFTINLAGVVTFAAQGVRPRAFWEAERARRATWTAIVSWAVLLAALAGIIWYL